MGDFNRTPMLQLQSPMANSQSSFNEVRPLTATYHQKRLLTVGRQTEMTRFNNYEELLQASRNQIAELDRFIERGNEQFFQSREIEAFNNRLHTENNK